MRAYCLGTRVEDLWFRVLGGLEGCMGAKSFESRV